MPEPLKILPADDLAAARFLVEARRAWAFLDGQVGGHEPGLITWGEDNGKTLVLLHTALARKFAEGVPAFWATRLWTNLLWQPVYLAMVGVYFANRLPDVTRISQNVLGADISGFRLANGPSHSGETHRLIERAGADLAAFAQNMLAQVNTIARVKRVPARRLLAARILRTLLYADRLEPGLIPDPRADARRWLSAANLVDQGRVDLLDMPGGGQIPILTRKGCCLDYLISPGTLCITCPKQSDAVRHERERAQYLELD